MASLGELTAGIAHEIQNPLNFVNNFSDVSNELIDEMNEELDKNDIEEARLIAADIKKNLEKISHHGKRADDIVKSMLQHSRSGSGLKEHTDLNLLADEYLRLAYHGLRAKEKSFNSDFKIELDEKLPKIDIVAQDIGRVILNLINNAFHAVADKARKSSVALELVAASEQNGVSSNGNGEKYSPLVSVWTRKRGPNIEIVIKDNGYGIPIEIREKIFQPFFTTKPTGEGTGLGLSMSYDIITKGHNGTIDFISVPGEGTEFTILLPINQPT
jgi:signal transduction histidine kinase